MNNNNIQFFPEPNSNLIRISAVWPVGIDIEEKPLQSHLSAQMLLKGTKKQNAKSFHQKLNYYGSTIDFYASKIDFTCDIFCHKNFLSPTLSLFYEAIAQPIFPKQEWDLLLNLRTEYLKELHLDNSAVADRLILEKIMEKEPYWYQNTLAHYSQISLLDCKNFFNKNISRFPPKWYIAGDISLNDLKLFENTSCELDFLQLSYNDTDLKTKNFGIPPKAIPSQSQQSIRVGTKIAFENEKEFLALEVLNMALGGYFQSELMKVLRQEKGYTYGVFSSISPLKHTGTITIQMEAAHKYTQDSLSTIFDIYNRFYTKKELLKEALVQYKASWNRSTNQVLSELEQRKQINRIGLDFDLYCKELNQFDIECIDTKSHPIAHIDKLKTVVI